VVDFGAALAEAEPRLQSVAPAGKNYALDAILDASRALGRRPSERRALVYVGLMDLEGPPRASPRRSRRSARRWWYPLIVLVQPGGAGASMGGPTSGISTSWDVQGYFEKMTPAYGGNCWVVLSSQAALNSLKEAAAIVGSHIPRPLRERRRRAGRAKGRGAPEGRQVAGGRTQVEVPRIN
jgi:hypothetical protein